MFGRDGRAIAMASALFVALVTALGQTAATGSVDTSLVIPGAEWALATPAQKARWCEAGLRKARDYSSAIHTSSVMIVQHGVVIDEWGPVEKKINSFSIRKSLISALYGIYANDGAIDPKATLAQLGVEDSPDPLTQDERQATVADLLRARSGVYHPVDFETPSMAAARPARGSHAPGTFWYYNNWDFNALGTIFEKAARRSVGAAFAERIARPIGMQDFQADDVYYLAGPVSIHRAYQFEISARDLARFGLLYLNRGKWGNRQIVPPEWVDLSSHAKEMVQSGNVDSGGYEYLWWVEFNGVHFPGAKVPPGTYSARGAGGHMVVVIPSLDLVIVHRGNNEPPAKDLKSVIESASKGTTTAEFGALLQMILDAESGAACTSAAPVPPQSAATAPPQQTAQATTSPQSASTASPQSASTSSSQTANAASSQQSSAVTVRGCLNGSQLTKIETDSRLNLPDTLNVSSIKVIRSEVKGLSGHRVELTGRLEGVPGQETGILIGSSDRAKVYLGGGDPSLGSDLGVGRPESPGIYASTIKDLAQTCEAATPK